MEFNTKRYHIVIYSVCKTLCKNEISQLARHRTLLQVIDQELPGHRVDKTYRDVTDRCKQCGRLRYHVPTFFQATGRKMINCACSASLK